MVQISALFADFRMNWPPILESLFQVFSALNFNIELFSPECAGNHQ